MANIREVKCKSAITSSSNYSYVFRSLLGIRSRQSLTYLLSALFKSTANRASSICYNVNPYVGCTHSCTYCYAEYQKGLRHIGKKWGSFVDVQYDLPDVLRTQVKTIPHGKVFIGSISDAYQPVEAKYLVTRNALEVLVSMEYEVTVLTKSSLITRDADLLKHKHCKAGLTLTVPDDETSSELESGASSTSERLKSLKELHDHGVKTWAYIAPILPTFTDDSDNIERLVGKLAECKVGFVTSDTFNPFPSSWSGFRTFLKQKYPERIKQAYEAIFLNREFFATTQERIKSACRNANLEYRSGSVM